MSTRAFLLTVNAVFPFLLPMKDWLNGHIIRGGGRFLQDAYKYRKATVPQGEFALKPWSVYPCLLDRYEQAGIVPRHYFWQDIWAARKVYELGVKRHYDIGSRLDGFIAHCLSFTEVVMLDIRPLPIRIPGLFFQQADCTSMKGIADGSLASLSSLHAVEHIGLGRYGDPVDPLGHVKAIDEMKRVVGRGGHIFFSVPIGRQQLEFNAHRIFDPLRVIELFDGCDLVEFCHVDDDNLHHEDSDPTVCRELKFGCGLYHFIKR